MSGDNETIVLRPGGIGRYFEAIFLGIWVAFWAVFEVVVFVVLGSVVLAWFGVLSEGRLGGIGRAAANRGTGLEIGLAFAFLGLSIWFALWTLAGAAAGYRLLRTVAGSDRLAVIGGELELVWRAGPFRRRYRYDRTSLRRLRIRSHDKALVADIESGTTTISDLGTPAEREAAQKWLQSRLLLDATSGLDIDPQIPPPGWLVARDESGALRLFRPMSGRRMTAAAFGGVAAIGLIVTLVEAWTGGGLSVGALSLVAFLSFAAAWIAWAREEWVARHQQLDYHFHFGPLGKSRSFRNGQIRLTTTTDSDGDERHELRVTDDSHSRKIATALHDGAEVTDMGRWLEAATGFRFTR